MELTARKARVLIFPYDDDITVSQMQGWIDELVSAGRIIVYEHNGKPLAYIPKFRDHQIINRPTPSVIPFPWESSINQTEIIDDSVSTHGALMEDSVSTHDQLTVLESTLIQTNRASDDDDALVSSTLRTTESNEADAAILTDCWKKINERWNGMFGMQVRETIRGLIIETNWRCVRDATKNALSNNPQNPIAYIKSEARRMHKQVAQNV
jgi:hypothetical protein